MRVLFVGALAVLTLAACSQSQSSNPAAPIAASPGAWVVDKDASKLSFTATQTGSAFEGEFETFSADIVFDPADLANASISIAVDTASAETGDRQRDTAMPGSDWFKAKEFPSATFVSNEVVETGEGAYAARGKLTIRGVTRDLVLPFTLAIDSGKAHAEGGVTLARTDYGVGQGEFSTDEWVGLEVGVSFVIEATKSE